MRWSGPWTIVGRTLDANRLLAGSACGKRHPGRPLNAIGQARECPMSDRAVQLLGFEKDPSLGPLLAQYGVWSDYRASLPDHLHGILAKQYPDVRIESVELLETSVCNLGGIQQEDSKSLIRVQDLKVPLELRLTLGVGDKRFVLEIQLVIICEGLDETPTTRSDMYIKAQRAIA
jgi:hypothetical protein